MDYQPIEDLAGSGRLWENGRDLGAVSYSVQTGRRLIDDGRGGTIPGIRRIRGQILAGEPNLLELLHRNADLTLELEDGRRWDCRLQSTDGTLVGRGGGTL